MSLDDIVRALATTYDADRPQLEADVMKLCQALCDERSLTIATEGKTGDERSCWNQTDRLPYAAPTLEKFTDMAEMFALDPPLPGLGTGPAARN